MRHKKKRNHLGRPADQRKALIRTMLTSLVEHESIMITQTRARVLKSVADKLVTLGKRGDVHAIRQAARLLYNYKVPGATMTTDNGKEIPLTILRKLFTQIAPRFTERAGGYTRVIKAPPRRGDAAPMALIEWTELSA